MTQESIIRILASQGILATMILLEYFFPLRNTIKSRGQRWLKNFGLGFGNVMLIRFTVGAIAYDSAVLFQSNGWGLMNLYENQSLFFNFVTFLITFMLLDMAIYFQHRFSHIVPFLWKFHKVHHTDLEFDVSTAVRFHPLEIFLSMVYKLIIILFIGANPFAVLVFEIALNAGSTFNHSNVRIPNILEKFIRYFMVTPDMHRIHHSVLVRETNSNYSFFLSIWDRIFSTYVQKAENPQETMLIGLESPRKELSFGRILQLPFLEK